MRSAMLTMVVGSGLVAAVSAFGQTVVPAVVVARVGETVSPGRTLNAMGTPFTTNDGVVGFVCTVGATELGTTTRGVWSGAGLVWTNDAAASPYVLSGAEDSMGVGANGQFIYSPAIDFAGDLTGSDDGVWSNLGYVASGDEAAPGVPGKFLKAMSAPSMFGDGVVAGFGVVTTLSNTPGGTTTSRAFYRGLNTASPALGLVFTVGGVVFAAPDAFPIKFATPTISFDYDVSDNGLHHVHVLGLETGQTFNDAYVYFDGVVLAREGASTGGEFGQIWENFSLVSVNNAGQTLVGGDATGASGDNCLAANGIGVMFEQETVAGIELAFPAVVRAGSVNNNGDAAFIWAYGPDIDFETSGTQQAKTVFYGDVNGLPGSAAVALSTLDTLDVTGDGVGDLVVRDILNNTGTTSPGLDYADDGTVALRVLVDDQGVVFEAVVTINPRAGEGCPADWDGDDDVDSDDIVAFFTDWDSGEGDIDGDSDSDSDDLIVFFGRFEGGC